MGKQKEKNLQVRTKLSINLSEEIYTKLFRAQIKKIDEIQEVCTLSDIAEEAIIYYLNKGKEDGKKCGL